jgi:hypothetical protein
MLFHELNTSHPTNRSGSYGGKISVGERMEGFHGTNPVEI